MTYAGSSRGHDAQHKLFDLTALQTASATDVGRVRSVNQDAFGEFNDASAGRHMLFVADGMGGHRGGEVASRLAVERVGEIFASVNDSPRALLDAAFQGANATIFEASVHDMELAGMGTTGVAILLTGEDTGYVAHVGDSRAYRMRGDQLVQLTGDHSVVGELVRRGQLTNEEARVHPQSNEILRALGTQEGVEVEIAEIDIEPGDRFLLCSDGLSGMLREERIAEALAAGPPEQAVQALVELANEAGGTDNITVQIALVPEGEPGDGLRMTGARPGEEAAAQGSMIRWALIVVLLAALLLLLFARPDSGG
jgi:protein phosphatase